MKYFQTILLSIIFPCILLGQSHIDSVNIILERNNNYIINTRSINYHKFTKSYFRTELKTGFLHVIGDSLIYDYKEKGFALATPDYYYQVFFEDSTVDCALLDRDPFAIYFISVWNFKKQTIFVKQFYDYDTINNDTLIIELLPNELEIRSIKYQCSDNIHIEVSYNTVFNNTIFYYELIPIYEEISTELLQNMSKIMIYDKKIEKKDQFKLFHLTNYLYQKTIEEKYT